MRFAPEVTPAARLRRLHYMPALCWDPRACGRACAPRARLRTSAAGSRSTMRTVLRQDENRLVDREQALRIRPPSASSVRRELPPKPSARSATARPATRARADPAATAMSTGARAVAAPSASFGAAAGAGSVASRSSLANAPCSSLALAKTPGARRLWAGACRRGTGVAGGVRVQPALQRPRGSPARPGLGAMSQPSQFWVRLEPDSDAPARGGRLFAGLPAAAAYLTTAGIHGVERHRRSDRRACRTHMGSEKGNARLTDRLSHVFSTRYEDRTVDPASTDFRFPAAARPVQIRSS